MLHLSDFSSDANGSLLDVLVRCAVGSVSENHYRDECKNKNTDASTLYPIRFQL